ncbi:hypothetical protein SLS60_007064 [Paraconiothyrium brasiliense]|uniref:Amino acid transporter n=1 Tax=Paraconiothyrium brasiliense TaxID=300254 RepID=A0ABR3R8B5_9PLEO
MSTQAQERDGSEGQAHYKPSNPETQPLLERRSSTTSNQSNDNATKQLTARHAFAVLVTLQIGSGIFASPAQVDSNVPSPGAALLVWVLGGLLSWAGAASFAELGAAIPLNGGMQAYLAYVYGDTMAFLMAWIYILAAKPSAMAIQSIVIAESIGSISSNPTAAWLLKLIAAFAFLAMVLLNSINTKVTLRLSESFTGIKLLTVSLVVIGGFVAAMVNPNSSLSGSKDWYSKNWFAARPTTSEGHIIDWPTMGTWERYGHYSAAIYGGLWAYDGWDNVSYEALPDFRQAIPFHNSRTNSRTKANVVASEIRNPGQALPKAIKAAMIVVLGSFELVNIAYYILLPWSTVSSSNAVAVVALGSVFGRWAGVLISVLVAVSCAGSITSNVFTIGRLTVAASEREYLPAILGKRGLPWRQTQAPISSNDPDTDSQINGIAFQNPDKISRFDAPM